ncbi:MAG: DUF1553 domain-containing protein [Planctomycetota bacterium]|nr:DUF1553 domain-containing protein [Planctomycetota bacterium]
MSLTDSKKKLFSPPEKPHTWGYLSASSGDPGIERYPVVNRKPIKWQPAALKNAEARMLIRGDVGIPGPSVDAGWPEVLGVTPSSLGEKPRSTLADWMADPKNPLVARVWVNRLWQFHFGRGIVATASDFGVKGAELTHPQLLDWLATESHGMQSSLLSHIRVIRVPFLTRKESFDVWTSETRKVIPGPCIQPDPPYHRSSVTWWAVLHDIVP